MKLLKSILVPVAVVSSALSAMEYHVSSLNLGPEDGTAEHPFRTISSAAHVAQPGDTITVHAGVYRERVTPPRGGVSPIQRIVYRASPGEQVVIKGSEVVRGWQRLHGGVWKVTLPNTFFGQTNPYKELIRGDWFEDLGRGHHTGEVYLNGKSLYETDRLEQVFQPQRLERSRDPEGSTWTWSCESDDQKTTIYANFHEQDPNENTVEINVRDSCFYPDQPGRDFITVMGFRICHAATQWAPPTAEQIGLIGTHWSRGWIIEDNVISDSKCSGLTLGKDRASGHNVWTENPAIDGTIHYNAVIDRALAGGWARERIGSHLIRRNTIFNCEQTGICGSLGAVFSEISDNHIYNIWTKRQFAGAEIAGIKIHGAIDVLIKGNRIHNTGRGLWMDWMAQGTRITGNLLYENTTDDLFTEVNHGPYLLDNNLFLSAINVQDWSEGGAYAHNLFVGQIISQPERNRTTPYHLAHSTKLAGTGTITGSDNRFYNNLFFGGDVNDSPKPDFENNNPERTTGFGLWVYDARRLPIHTGGNFYTNEARSSATELNASRMRPLGFPRLVESGGQVFLDFDSYPDLQQPACVLVTTQLLGETATSGLPFENSDGSALSIDTDFFGKSRSRTHPAAGPFESVGTGLMRLKVW
jgi:hypothetical protein